MKKIYILLPVYNRIEKTKLFIESLLAQTYANYQLILIDDGSTDGTAEYVKSKVRALSVVTGNGDWWWGGGLHQGYLWLKKNSVCPDDLVLMINNDTEFSPGFFQTAIDILNSRNKTLLGAQAYSRQTGDLLDVGVHVDWRRMTFEEAEAPKQVNCLSTRGLFLRARDLMDIGGFHPFVLPHYLSDYEFTIRAYRKGYILVTEPSLALSVDESTTGYLNFGRTLGRREFLKKYFSKRSTSNPLSWLSFVVLACPWPWKILNISRVMYAVPAVVIRAVRGGRQ